MAGIEPPSQPWLIGVPTRSLKLLGEEAAFSNNLIWKEVAFNSKDTENNLIHHSFAVQALDSWNVTCAAPNPMAHITSNRDFVIASDCCMALSWSILCNIHKNLAHLHGWSRTRSKFARSHCKVTPCGFVFVVFSFQIRVSHSNLLRNSLFGPYCTLIGFVNVGKELLISFDLQRGPDLSISWAENHICLAMPCTSKLQLWMTESISIAHRV